MTTGGAPQGPRTSKSARPSVGSASQAPRLGASKSGQTSRESSLLKPGPTKLGPSKAGAPPKIGPPRPAATRPEPPKLGPTKLFPSKPTLQKPGPPVRRPTSISGPSGQGSAVAGSGSIPKNINLSTINRINKKARNEREPDFNSLDLFEASNPVSFSKRPSLETVRLSPKDLQSLRMSKQGPEDEGRVFSRGPWGMGRREHGQSHDGDLVMSPAPQDRIISAPTADIEAGLGKSNLRLNSNKKVFECELKIQRGDGIESLGVVQFSGFSTQFLEFLERSRIRELCVTKLLADSHVSGAVINEIGYPQEFADITILNADMAQPLIITLAKFHAVGIVREEAFTVAIFQPSSDKITTSFKAPLQKQKTPLRAVAYSSWRIPEPSRELVPAELHEVGGHMTQYLHTLGEKVLSISPETLIAPTEANPEGVRYFAVYCPDDRFYEKLEMEINLKTLGLKVLDSEELVAYLSRGKKIIVLVHYTLQFCLHLLPNLKPLQAREHLFFFFGTRFVDNGRTMTLDARPIRFWSFATLILATPNLALSDPPMLKRLLDYQAAKAGSTTLCMVSTMVVEVEKRIIHKPEDYENTKAILDAVYRMQDCTGDTLQISLREGFNELEVIADAFAHHQAINCTLYRRFIVVHAKDEALPGIGGRYACLEFHNPDSLFEVVMKGVVPPSRVKSST
ncbi:hypothetical protein L873DRAFT_1681771 [Choiromyces venosus 120613-1]|uniref:Uncharacterized protein n=1 Tax=Choiromyces venosus 120613-1 TaxID=1336337 RepID=A0A3N4JP21_9PEZI|nr:hypothetical protein L873DRAFT_1681771 [Choiromyces venosus 120613-1]